MKYIKTCGILTQNKPESNKREEIFALIVATIGRTKVMLKLALASALSLACITATHSFDQGQYESVDPKIRDWFKSIQNQKGVRCCDMADGHRTDYDHRDDGYWVPLGGEWRKIPNEAVILNAGNPVGEAIVWYSEYQGYYAIRCFVPGGGV